MLKAVPIATVPWSDWTDASYEQDAVVETLTLPITTIVITLETSFCSCHSGKECEERMREVQSFYRSQGSCANIPFNFMIGNDGCFVYEGRGWKEKPLKSFKYNHLKDQTIDIAVLGKNQEEQNEALDTLHRFVKEGIEMTIISEQHRVRSFLGEKMLF